MTNHCLTRHFQQLLRPVRLAWWCCVVLCLCCAGCSSGGDALIKVSKKSVNPFTSGLDLLINPDTGKASTRTEQFLRRYDLLKHQGSEPNVVLKEIQLVLEKEPTPDGCQAYSELAYLAARKYEKDQPEKALGLYGAAVTHTYYYLFDPRFSSRMNPYDPQFRQACNLYNDSLKNCLKLTHKIKKLTPDGKFKWQVGEHTWEVESLVRGCSWQLDEFSDFEFVDDYKAEGLANNYRTFGLGVPLIAIRKPGKSSRPEEKHFPPNLSFPMTAFVRLLPDPHGSHAHQTPQAGTTCRNHRAQLEFYDPLRASDIVLDNRLIPLETDLSTPLAYYLSNPILHKTDYSTLGLLNYEATSKISGIYMLEPYSPYKIPVILVHGLWSSPMTWMEMFNDLQGDVELRQRYQFWFYFYPTGQPFWFSGSQFRRDLAELKTRLDPNRQSYAMDQMVLVGHSMGGLVSRMQTVESGNDFWKLVSDRSIQELQGRGESPERVKELFYFQPNPSIKQVITIGTPHLGSGKSNSATQWISNKLISIPSMRKSSMDQVLSENPTLFRDKSFFNISTSVDSLSPQSPFLPVLYKSRSATWTRYHNIIGRVPQKGWYYFSSEGDGVVELKNARLPGVPETIVPADHVSIHRHPQSILQVRTILHDHAGTRKNITNPWQKNDREHSIAQQPGPVAPVMSSLGVPVPQQPSQSSNNNPPVSSIQPSQFQQSPDQAPWQLGPGQVPAANVDPSQNLQQSLLLEPNRDSASPATEPVPTAGSIAPGIPMADTPQLNPLRR